MEYFQDFVRDEWRINLECIDGLGATKLSFVRENGLFLRGKQTALDIINCLFKKWNYLAPNNSIGP
jgi:hypothetical protein